MSPSLQYRALTAILHRMEVPSRVMADMAAERTRVKAPPVWLPTPRRFQHDGHTVYRFGGEGAGRSRRRVLHLHGGAFVYGLIPAHYGAAHRLARLSGAEVWLPEYPLPPAGDARATTAWTDGLLDLALSDREVVLTGDSAGAGLALGAAARRAARGGSLPERLVLLCPWADLTGGADDETWADADEPLLSAKAGAAAARRYAGGLDLADPLVSPFFAELGALPPTTIVAGRRDILWPDIVRLRDRLVDASVTTDLIEEPTLGHYWMYYPVPEAKRTWETVAALVRAGG